MSKRSKVQARFIRLKSSSSIYSAVILSNTTAFHPTSGELNDRGHEKRLEIVYEEFVQVCVFPRRAASLYTIQRRGISVDGTLLKTCIGDVHLVACFIDGNNEIQIIGVGIVSVENEDSWTWF